MASRAPRRDAVGSARERRRLLAEKAQHFARGVGAAGLGIGARRAAAGPGMAGAMKHPLLQHRTTALIRLDASDIADTAGRLAPADGEAEVRRRLCLGNDLIAIDRIDGGVAIAMEDDGRNEAV